MDVLGLGSDGDCEDEKLRANAALLSCPSTSGQIDGSRESELLGV